ncbi:aminotransferase class V-fold PLP-dependent enzyme [Catalinimonas niigatensis]|uniref:aminotransferase class V-fold PLP-dependent enzyme n=1 Tax=Catalinimonas niigatensis TaxID=1397264 RepID=UPI0026656D0C|nr:aminotransferase class V-fold PLP-dependent enzyme [Catalinimonas niigatensis]WPP52341.1 aminotransferase class V-fold PLP-dependent enzyme [Catalinimonas niigatensis]
MKNIYFTPGPAELYFTVEGHIKNALKEQIPSISHRSKTFQGIYHEATSNLKQLLNVPDGYHIFFTGSATEIWERILENCVEHKSHHYVNGAFSERFQGTAEELTKKTDTETAEAGSCVNPNPDLIAPDTELIAFTLNETSTGASQPLEDIYAIHQAHPDKLIAVDAVSILPHPDIDYTQVDTVFFSVQKAFGLPAGLGVWIVSPRCVEKAQNLQKKGINIGSYHSLPSLLSKGMKDQTPETPNVLNIYLLSKVCADMLSKGISKIRQETEYKAALLYHAVEVHPHLNAFVKDDAYRSKTVIVADTQIPSSEIIEKLKKDNLVVGSGYGDYKSKQIRIANFPTHSKEQFELLVDKINALK